MSEPIRVLALHAHPDDVEFQCAGTLVLLREAGCHVTIATMTPGDCGSAEHDAETIAAIRRDEARASAALIGADYRLPRIPRPGHLQRRRFAAPGDRGPAADAARHHPDGTAGRLHRRPRDDQPAGPRCVLRGVVPELRDAAVGARAPARGRSRISTSSIRWRGATATGGRCRSISYVDVSRVFATKREMLACHASQRNWLLRQHGIDEYLEMPGAVGSQSAGPRSESPRPRRSASIAVIPIRTTTSGCCRTARAGMPDAGRRSNLGSR